jgi:aminoglycoside 6'-N-acetyltransferase
MTTVRPANDDDVDMLVAWHEDPEVARFWDGETFTREEMHQRLARSDVESFVVEEGSTPLGYLQVWHEGEDTGLDMFLVPEARGRGLGSDAARAVASHLVAAGRCSRVTVDPYVWNEPAVRAWRRAGFVDVEEREADEGHTAPWLLMEFRP